MRAPWNRRKVHPVAERAEEAQEALGLAEVLRDSTKERMERRAAEIKANHFADDIKRYLEVHPL